MNRGPWVVDTNVVVAGLLTADPGSPPARILDAMLEGRLLYLLSEALLAEYRMVLLRPKIRGRHRLAETEIDQLLVELVRNGQVREAPRVDVPGADPSDAHLWGLARAHPGAMVVTGDEALRRAAPEWTVVVTPRELVDSG